MIILTPDLVLEAETNLSASQLDHPVIGQDNIVTISNIAATSATSDDPATNMANPATDLEWTATSTATQYVTVTTGTSSPVSYFGVAGHNLGSAQIPTSVEVDTGSGYTQIIAPMTFADDKPLLFRFDSQSLAGIRLKLQTGIAPASIAAVRVGSLLVLPRKIYVPHVPITYNRQKYTANNVSANGKFLGLIQTGETNVTDINLQNLDPAWYRTYLDPVIDARDPFFWAWRPVSYPTEVAYAWITNNPKPTNQRTNGMMQVTLSVEGEA